MSLPLIDHRPSSTASFVGVSGKCLAASSKTLAATQPMPPVATGVVPGTYCFSAASHSATAGWSGGVILTPEVIQAPSMLGSPTDALKAVPMLMMGTSKLTLLHDRRSREAEVPSIPRTRDFAPAFLAWTQADV